MNASEWRSIEEQVRGDQGHDWKAQRQMHFRVLHIDGPQKKSLIEMKKHYMKCEGLDYRRKRRSLWG